MVWQASSTNANPLNRGKVIEIICRLELVASQLLSQEFKNRNPEYRENLIHKQLFGENGIVGTLGKMSVLLHNLGYLNAQELNDLRKIYRIRCIYAHSPNKRMLSYEPDVFKNIEGCYWYKKTENKVSIDTGDYYEERVFIAICQSFQELIRSHLTEETRELFH